MRFAARLLLLTGLAAMAIAPAAPSRAQFATPEAVVLAVYAHYGVGQNEMRGFPSDRSAVKRFLDASLLSGWDRAHQASEAALDYDYFIQGQDWALTPVQVSRHGENHGKAVVRARLKNFANPVVIDFELIRNADGWRIYDAKAKGDASLRQRLKVSR